LFVCALRGLAFAASVPARNIRESRQFLILFNRFSDYFDGA